MKHPLLVTFDFQHPGPLAQAVISNYRHKRHMALTRLEQPKDGSCKWCNIQKVPGRRHYCTDWCADSAYMFCYPQSPHAKAWVFISLQDCTCTACGEIFDEEISKLIESKYKRFGEWQNKKGLAPAPVSYHTLMANTGELWHVDHVIPVSRGGDGLGFENIQVICKRCHVKKTAREAMGLPVVKT